MRIRRPAHVHPETYCATDPFDWRRVQLHTSRYQCDQSWCTFGDWGTEMQDRCIAEAVALRAEILAADNDAALKRITELRDQGMTWRALSEQLNAEGITTPSGKRWGANGSAAFTLAKAAGIEEGAS
jgi:hypothetical protein